MNRLIILFFSIFLSAKLFGQTPTNDINTLLVESLRDYIVTNDLSNISGHRYEPNIRKKRSARMKPMSQKFFLCNDGLPSDFPYDSLNVECISLKYSHHGPNREKLRSFKTVITVKYRLEGNNMEIIVGNQAVKRKTRHHLISFVSAEDTKHYHYTYSLEENKWNPTMQ